MKLPQPPLAGEAGAAEGIGLNVSQFQKTLSRQNQIAKQENHLFYSVETYNSAPYIILQMETKFFCS